MGVSKMHVPEQENGSLTMVVSLQFLLGEKHGSRYEPYDIDQRIESFLLVSNNMLTLQIILYFLSDSWSL